MKLGQEVEFSRYYVKNSNIGVDPYNDSEDGIAIFEKLVPIDLVSKYGIIVGKRLFGTTTELHWLDDGNDSRWVGYKTKKEPFYLVACTLSGFYKVKESDLWVIDDET